MFRVFDVPAIGADVGQVNATDPDRYNDLRYSIIPGSGRFERRGNLVPNPNLNASVSLISFCLNLIILLLYYLTLVSKYFFTVAL